MAAVGASAGCHSVPGIPEEVVAAVAPKLLLRNDVVGFEAVVALGRVVVDEASAVEREDGDLEPLALLPR